jgi:hypothetical protein
MRGGEHTKEMSQLNASTFVKALLSQPVGEFLNTALKWMSPSILTLISTAERNLGAAMLRTPYGDANMLSQRANEIIKALQASKRLDLTAPAYKVLPVRRVALAAVNIYPRSSLRGGVDAAEQEVWVCNICYADEDEEDPPRPRAQNLLECNHNNRFHAQCLTTWVNTRQPNCPLCRGPARPNAPPRRPARPRPEPNRPADNLRRFREVHEALANRDALGLTDTEFLALHDELEELEPIFDLYREQARERQRAINERERQEFQRWNAERERLLAQENAQIVEQQHRIEQVGQLVVFLFAILGAAATLYLARPS